MLVPIEFVQLLPISANHSNEQRVDVEGGEILLVEGVVMTVTCLATVDGSLTAPTVHLNINGKNVTNMFSLATVNQITNQVIKSPYWIAYQ